MVICVWLFNVLSYSVFMFYHVPFLICCIWLHMAFRYHDGCKSQIPSGDCLCRWQIPAHQWQIPISEPKTSRHGMIFLICTSIDFKAGTLLMGLGGCEWHKKSRQNNKFLSLILLMDRNVPVFNNTCSDISF